MKSVMSHDFGQVPLTDIERSTFDRSHGYKTAFDSGVLVPFYCDEVLPGDEFKLTANILARLSSPLVTPVMDNVFLDTFFFYVPSRLVWKNFVKMMGERVCPNDSIDYSVPTINSGGGFAVGSLADYFGIPTRVPNLDVNVLPFRCYAKIWDDWFRDSSLQDSIIKDENMLGDDTSTGWSNPWNYTLLPRCKKADYFTKALPWPQMGAGVELPLGVEAPVVGTGDPLNFGASKLAGQARYINNTSTPGQLQYVNGQNQSKTSEGQLKVTTEVGSSGLKADLSSATATTINSLRTAFQIQRMLETDARCGCSRYISVILAHFKTVVPDNRLQRSEYLGGSSQAINISTISQTSATSETSDTPQGNLAATAMISGKSGFSKGFVEHGYIIGLVNVRADINYQQGLNRLWSRRTRYDFYWPTLAHLGEQAVLNKEIFAQGASIKDNDGNVVDDQPFGYQERFAEYRYHPSLITGKLRSGIPSGSLDVWHLAPNYTSLPKLNSEWIKDNPPLDRVLAVQNEPQIIMDSYIQCKCTRPMPVYSVPGLVDHF